MNSEWKLNRPPYPLETSLPGIFAVGDVRSGSVQRVAAAVGEDGEVGEIFEAWFFDAVRKKTLDINLEENPYPALAAVRALATAKKLKFSMTARLARYIVDTERHLGAGALVSVQDAHYGLVRFRQKEIQFLVRHLARELQGNTSSVTLPSTKLRQLSLWPRDLT